MDSRYASKLKARDRGVNTARKTQPAANLPPVPRHLKQRVTDLILEGRDKSQFEPRSFGCKALFLPGKVIEVVWRTPRPTGLPRVLTEGKTEYRLVHRDREGDEAWGEEDPMLNVSNGYKWYWWRPRDPHAKDSFTEDLLAAWRG